MADQRPWLGAPGVTAEGASETSRFSVKETPEPTFALFGGTIDLMPSITGLNHVRLPVSDVGTSTDWYVTVFELETLLYNEEESGPIGAVLRHSSGFVVGLHLDPARARAMQGFAILGLTVDDRSDLEWWIRRLDGLGMSHSGPLKGQLGWYLEVPDPDGIILQLHTGEQPNTEED